MQEEQIKDLLAKTLQKYLSLKIERTCKGDLSPMEEWLVISVGDKVVSRVLLNEYSPWE